MKKIDQLLEITTAKKITIGVINSVEEDIIRAIIEMLQWANFRLYGDEKQIKELLRGFNFTPSSITIINCLDIDECLAKAIADVNNELVNILMKGLISTKQLLSAVLNKKNLLYDANKILSHITVADIPTYHKLLIISDCALNIAPDEKQFIKIINNAIAVANILQITKPRVALLAAIEKENIKMPVTSLWTKIVALKTEIWNNAIEIAGPLALDNAISAHAANVKTITNKVAGNADILIVPNIESGNILYKSLVYFAQAITAGIVVGAKIPIILTSRADSAVNKRYSIALAIQIILQESWV